MSKPTGWGMIGKKDLDKGGMKADNGKPRYSLIPTEILEEVAKVFTYGADKYEDHNYAKGMRWSRLIDAADRHIKAILKDELIDESSYSHIAHAICSLMMLSVVVKHHPELDDRLCTFLKNLNKEETNARS